MENTPKVCFFFGHHDAPNSILFNIADEVKRHIEKYGVTEFVVGHYGNFDWMATYTVMLAKKTHPNVKLTMLLPYHPSKQPVKLPTGFDGTFYPPGMETVPGKFAIIRANEYMLDHSDYLIAYINKPSSHSLRFKKRAKTRNLQGTLHVSFLK